MSLNKPLIGPDEFDKLHGETFLYMINNNPFIPLGPRLGRSARSPEAVERYKRNRAKRKKKENTKRRCRNKLARKSRRKNRR